MKKKWLVCKISSILITCYEWIINWVYLSIFNTISIIKDYYYDKEFGIETRRWYLFRDEISLHKDMHIYRPVSYEKLIQIINELKLSHEDVFVDLGCGKGRVIFLVAMQTIKRVVGVELNKKLVDIAKRNLSYLKLKKTPVEIVDTDAAVFDVNCGTVFFLFDPFGPKTLTKIIDNIEESLIRCPRKIRIVYFRALYNFILDNKKWLLRETKSYNSGYLVWRNIKYIPGIYGET